MKDEMRIITVANQKGGVGKTTTAINLGTAIAEAGLRCLVIDLGSLATHDEHALVADAVLERLWRLRESHTEAIGAHGIPHKLDVGVPLDALAPFCDAVRAARASMR